MENQLSSSQSNDFYAEYQQKKDYLENLMSEWEALSTELEG